MNTELQDTQVATLTRGEYDELRARPVVHVVRPQPHLGDSE